MNRPLAGAVLLFLMFTWQSQASTLFSGAQNNGPALGNACPQETGTASVSDVCSCQSGLLSYFSSASAQASYGQLSASAEFSLVDVPFIANSQGADAYVLSSSSYFADHLYVAGTGQASVTFHFSRSGSPANDSFSCSACSQQSVNLGETSVDLTETFAAGFGAGEGLDFAVSLTLPLNVIVLNPGDNGSASGFAQLTLTGVDSVGTISSDSGSIYSSNGVSNSTPEPVSALLMSGALGLLGLARRLSLL